MSKSSCSRLLLVLLASCAEVSSFPERHGPGTSPMVGGVSCRSMLGGAMGCTSWDGHHTLTLGAEHGFDRRRFYSDLGEAWGKLGPWHEITDAQEARWNEDRSDVPPPRGCPTDEEQWWTRGDWPSQRELYCAKYPCVP